MFFFIEFYYYGWFTNEWLPRFILNCPRFLYYIRGSISTVSFIISISILIDLIVTYVIPSTTIYSNFYGTSEGENVTNDEKKRGNKLSELSAIGLVEEDDHEQNHLYNIEMNSGYDSEYRKNDISRRDNFLDRSQDYDTSFNNIGFSKTNRRIDDKGFLAPRHSLLTRPIETIYTMDQLGEFINGVPKPKISELDFNDKFSAGYPTRNLGIQKNGLNGINNFVAITNDTNAASKMLFQYQRENKEDGYSSTHEDSSTSALGKQKKKSPSSGRSVVTTMKLLRNRGTRSSPNIYGLEETLQMYKMSYGTLCRCEGKLRVWIKQTILKPLLEKIESANKQLLKDYPGLHLKVGESNLDTLQCFAATKPEIFKNSTLSYVLPFLKVCQDQEYLFQRLKELTADHSLKSYLWKAIEKTSPGEVLRLLVNNKSTATQEENKNKSNTFSPPKITNDTEILLHMFLTYMDSVLTSNPFAAYKDVEMPFTAIYFLRAPNEPSIIHRAHSSFYLHLDKQNPIHMRLVINGGEEIMDLGADQNNFFRTIVLFVQHCYLYNNRMVDRISLSDKSLNWKNIIM